jgi:hypothetical protein
LATAFAVELLPQPEYPSIAMTILPIQKTCVGSLFNSGANIVVLIQTKPETKESL